MKVVLRIVIALLLTVAVLFLPKKLIDQLNTDTMSEELYRRRQSYYTGVIQVWQIDCFEGGTGSRAQWLRDVAGAFEKKHNGVYINVENVPLLLAERLLETGERKADVISFGAGMNVSRLRLAQLDENTENLFSFLKPVCLQEAIPWCMGAYCVLGETENWGKDGFEDKRGSVYSLGIAQRAGYDPFSALSQADLTQTLSFRESTDTQVLFDAYMNGRIRSLVGTQRDVYRLFSRQNRGAVREGSVTLLEDYDDLFQFVGILQNSDEKKMSMMQELLAFLLEKEQQDRLGEIGMFPVRADAEPIYSPAYVQEMWTKIKQADPVCTTSLWRTEAKENGSGR